MVCNNKEAIVKSFFNLLKVELGAEIDYDVVASSLQALTPNDWIVFKDFATKQGVSALTFSGLSTIVESIGYKKICPQIDYKWWQQFILNWVGVLQQTEYQNLHQIETIKDLAQKWCSQEVRVMVFKGQANSVMYPHPHYRSPGDVDCYLFGKYSLGNKIATEFGALVDDSWYKHSEIRYQGELFENHQFFVHQRSGKRGKELEQELERRLDVPDSDFLSLIPSVIAPPKQWTALFLTYHACSHFLTEGLRIKQVLDWAMLLKQYQYNIDWSDYYSFCDKYKLRNFSEALTSICVNYLRIEIFNPYITTSNPFSNKILESTLFDDDFIYSKTNGGWKEKWYVIRNLFKYRWKYEEICEESIWKQLWFYVTGYLFKTEN